MRFNKFGSTGHKVGVMGQGTWNIEAARRAEAVAALQRGIDLGMTHIDTAEMYGSGAAEDIVGEAITGRREQVYLVSKVLPHNASRSGTIKACEASLRRLKTSYLDCYLLHWRGSVPLMETIAGMEELVRGGKIRAWGVSNFDTDDLDEAVDIAGTGRLACNQVLYHLLERAIEHAVIPWCERNDVAVVAYSPFGHNNFPSLQSPGGRVLVEIGKKHDATPHQVALAYLARRPSVFAIPKAAAGAHVTQNAAAGDLVLAPEELAKIDQAFPSGRPPRSLPML